MQLHSKVGLIGIGSMGHHFLNNFLKSGVEMVISDKNQQALAVYAGNDLVTIVETPQEVANYAEVVFVSLPTPQIVRDVALGKEGIIHGTKVKTYVDLSTTGLKVAVEVGEQLKQKGIEALDAPISGGADGAREATLAVMVSGSNKAYEEIKPLLSVIGKNIFYIGDQFGQGQAMKLVNNLLSATAMAATSEAVLLGAKAGIDPEIMVSVINAGSGRNTASMDKFPKYILPGTYDYGFKTGLMYKDINLCMQLAEELNFPMFLGSSVKQTWGYVVSQGGADKDFTTIFQYLQSLTNSPVETETKSIEELTGGKR